MPTYEVRSDTFVLAGGEDLLYVEMDILPTRRAAADLSGSAPMEFPFGSDLQLFLPVPAVGGGGAWNFLKYSVSPEEARGLVGRVLERFDGELGTSELGSRHSCTSRPSASRGGDSLSFIVRVSLVRGFCR